MRNKDSITPLGLFSITELNIDQDEYWDLEVSEKSFTLQWSL